jgi:hypothetical protein
MSKTKTTGKELLQKVAKGKTPVVEQPAPHVAEKLGDLESQRTAVVEAIAPKKGKSKTSNGAVATTLAPAATPKPAPKPELVPKAPAPVENINRRVTEGAEVKEWRTARSLRVKQPGYFAQGGYYKKGPRGNEFVVGEERHFTNLRECQEYCNSRRPQVS